MVEHRDIIVTQKIKIHFGGIKLTFHFGYGWKKYSVTMDPYFGTLIPSDFVPWLLTHFACDNIDIDYSILDDETFPMLRAEQMDLKPSIIISLHASSTFDTLHAGSTGDTRVSSG